MRYYLDTEFDEPKMQLITVGLVDQTGRKFYGVNTEYDWGQTTVWLYDNVKPHLAPEKYVRRTVGGHLEAQSGVLYVEGSIEQIAQAVRDWCNLDQALEGHEFWAYYADWDWVLFRRMFGSWRSAQIGARRRDQTWASVARFDDMPMALPLLCFDLKQLAVSANIQAGLSELVKPIQPQHNALADAEWCKLVHEMFILQYGRHV